LDQIGSTPWAAIDNIGHEKAKGDATPPKGGWGVAGLVPIKGRRRGELALWPKDTLG